MFEPRLIFEPWLELFKFCVLCYANYFNFSISGMVAISCRDESTLNIEIQSSYVNFNSSTELMFTYCSETNGKIMSSNVTIRNRLKSASLCLLVKYLSWSSLINLRFGVRKCSFLINVDFELLFLADIIDWNMVDRNAVTRNHNFFCVFFAQ